MVLANVIISIETALAMLAAAVVGVSLLEGFVLFAGLRRGLVRCLLGSLAANIISTVVGMLGVLRLAFAAGPEVGVAVAWFLSVALELVFLHIALFRDVPVRRLLAVIAIANVLSYAALFLASAVL